MSGQSVAPELHRSLEEILAHAREFQEQYIASLKNSSPADLEKRMSEIANQVSSSGIYELTYDELSFGAKLAWRNAPRCIGRIQWNKLEVQDCRKITSSNEMFDALCNQLSYATNGGNIRSMITVFPPRVPGREDYRLWNPQLINFAGYLQPDGSTVGDPGRVQLTRICQRLGWRGKGGRFDVLPWVMSVPGEGPRYYEIPEELILRIKLEHPRYSWFADMNISWYAVPAVADMMLDLGGLAFTAAPFNGWYMGTEIGARNLCDPHRYNLSEEFAEKMGLDTSSPTTLWKDTVLVEVNVAILYSYRKNQVTIVDHHTASETFMKHMANEQKLRGGCPADWVWIVPPISGSATPVFHQEMVTYNLKPSYEYQKKAWIGYNWPKRTDISLKYRMASIAKAVFWCVALMAKRRTARVLATILYATETGKSETFASKLERLLQASFNVRVSCMEDYDFSEINSETMLFVVASTFGSGEPPDNGKGFWSQLKKMQKQKQSLPNIKYGVFALGSSQYPNFCNFGKNVDKTLHALGGHRLMDVKLGDELRGQEHTFNAWLPEIYEVSCKSEGVEASAKAPLMDAITRWKKENFRIVPAENSESTDLIQNLSALHNKAVFPLKLSTKFNLQARHSENKTILVRLESRDTSHLKYEPGDHLGVFPANPKFIVDAVIKKLQSSGVDVDEVIKVECLKDDSWKVFKRLPATSVRTYLQRILDITSPPSPHVLDLFSELATDQWHKYRLKRLAKVSDDYEEWQSLRCPHLAEVLEEFPSIKLDPTLLLSELPLLQPRYYSISSSYRVCPGQVHLTVALVSYRTQDGKGPVHQGVCTSYLNSFPDEDIPCFVRKAQGFHMPTDKSTPLILVGAGSGIAPFRSFWQEREADIKESTTEDSNKLGPMVLFFGCRQPGVDNIYEHETSPLLRKGALSRVFTAYSRETSKPKRYVQHEILTNSDLVWQLLSVGAHVYVCGDAVMASDVKSTLNNILQEKLGGDIDDLIESGRYHEDVFGVLRRRN